MGELLSVKNINVYYGSIHAIKDVSFHVDEGEIVTLIGANGAGKTTTMHAISGLLKLASGEITYEAGAIISRSPALSAGAADCIKLADSPYRRRFAPLVSAGVRLGYLICVDTDGHLEKIPAQTWNTVEQILSKQLFVEASRQDKPFETAEDILRHLLDGGFPSAPYFRLQISGTYLVDFHPLAFALIDLTVYHSGYLGQRHLKEEVTAIFLDSHSFLYKGNVMLFLHRREDMERFSALAEEFQLKVIVSEKIDDLFALPALYPVPPMYLSPTSMSPSF